MPLIALIIILGYLVGLAVVSGASLDVFWAWFIQPVFHSAPDLTIGTALGVALVVGWFTANTATNSSNKSAEDAVAAWALSGFLKLALFWIFALVYHFVFGIGA